MGNGPALQAQLCPSKGNPEEDPDSLTGSQSPGPVVACGKEYKAQTIPSSLLILPTNCPGSDPRKPSFFHTSQPRKPLLTMPTSSFSHQLINKSSSHVPPLGYFLDLPSAPSPIRADDMPAAPFLPSQSSTWHGGSEEYVLTE